jgi:hypothetical protein
MTKAHQLLTVSHIMRNLDTLVNRGRDNRSENVGNENALPISVMLNVQEWENKHEQHSINQRHKSSGEHTYKNLHGITLPRIGIP